MDQPTRYRIDSFELNRRLPGYTEKVGVGVTWRKAPGSGYWQLHAVVMVPQSDLVMALAVNSDLETTLASMAHDAATAELAEDLRPQGVVDLGDRLVAPWPAVVYTDTQLYGKPEYDKVLTMQGVRELLVALLAWKERNGGDWMNSDLVYSLLLGLWETELVERLDEYVAFYAAGGG